MAAHIFIRALHVEKIEEKELYRTFFLKKYSNPNLSLSNLFFRNNFPTAKMSILHIREYFHIVY